MPNILLLRTPSTTPPDPYESAFASTSYTTYSLPILQTSFTNLSSLQSLISSGPHSNEKKYAGMIITSKRSCEAWTAATKDHERQASQGQTCPADLKSSLVAWTNVPFYVVGKGTASALEEFRKLCSNISPNTRLDLDIRGQDSGTGEQLAHFILDDISKNKSRSSNYGVVEDTDTMTLLYLTGDRNRDTVPKILSSPHDGEGRSSKLNIDLDEIQVYETHGASDFESNLDSLMAQPHKDDIWWITFFAPSSSQFAYPFLQKHFRFTSISKGDAPPKSPASVSTSTRLPMARVAAIGQVTSTYLEGALKIRIDAIATKPSPEALADAISSALQ